MCEVVRWCVKDIPQVYDMKQYIYTFTAVMLLVVTFCRVVFYTYDLYVVVFFFFFKQKTAYEISLGLVGSEMCIRDRTTRVSAEDSAPHP